MLNHEIFSKGMVRLSNFFKKESMSDLFYEDYYIAVSQVSDNAFTRAVDYLIKNHKSGFFPVPGEFWQAVTDSKDAEKVTPPDKQIEMNYTGCPPETRKFIEETMERLKNKT